MARTGVSSWWDERDSHCYRCHTPFERARKGFFSGTDDPFVRQHCMNCGVSACSDHVRPISPGLVQCVDCTSDVGPARETERSDSELKWHIRPLFDVRLPHAGEVVIDFRRRTDAPGDSKGDEEFTVRAGTGVALLPPLATKPVSHLPLRMLLTFERSSTTQPGGWIVNSLGKLAADRWREIQGDVANPHRALNAAYVADAPDFLTVRDGTLVCMARGGDEDEELRLPAGAVLEALFKALAPPAGHIPVYWSLLVSPEISHFKKHRDMVREIVERCVGVGDAAEGAAATQRRQRTVQVSCGPVELEELKPPQERVRADPSAMHLDRHSIRGRRLSQAGDLADHVTRHLAKVVIEALDADAYADADHDEDAGPRPPTAKELVKRLTVPQKKASALGRIIASLTRKNGLLKQWQFRSAKERRFPGAARGAAAAGAGSGSASSDDNGDNADDAAARRTTKLPPPEEPSEVATRAKQELELHHLTSDTERLREKHAALARELAGLRNLRHEVQTMRTANSNRGSIDRPGFQMISGFRADMNGFVQNTAAAFLTWIEELCEAEERAQPQPLKTIRERRQRIQGLISSVAKTIFHTVENDLKALRQGVIDDYNRAVENVRAEAPDGTTLTSVKRLASNLDEDPSFEELFNRECTLFVFSQWTKDGSKKAERAVRECERLFNEFFGVHSDRSLETAGVDLLADHQPRTALLKWYKLCLWWVIARPDGWKLDWSRVGTEIEAKVDTKQLRVLPSKAYKGSAKEVRSTVVGLLPALYQQTSSTSGGGAAAGAAAGAGDGGSAESAARTDDDDRWIISVASTCLPLAALSEPVRDLVVVCTDPGESCDPIRLKDWVTKHGPYSDDDTCKTCDSGDTLVRRDKKP